ATWRTTSARRTPTPRPRSCSAPATFPGGGCSGARCRQSRPESSPRPAGRELPWEVSAAISFPFRSTSSAVQSVELERLGPLVTRLECESDLGSLQGGFGDDDVVGTGLRLLKIRVIDLADCLVERSGDPLLYFGRVLELQIGRERSVGRGDYREP